MDQVPPVVLQGAALWLLLLALLLSHEIGPKQAQRRRIEKEPSPTECPFCGAPFEGYRVCWCGSDGHWL